MEAKQVIEKILADAKAEAQKLKKQADQKQADQQAELDKELAQYKKQTDALAQKVASDEKLHLLAAARMEIAKEHLAEKRKILDEVFTRARRQLLDLPLDRYKKLMTALCLETVETGGEEVIIDSEEKRIDESFIEHVNSKLGSGRKRELKLSKQRQNIGGGFILKRGKIKTNVSIDVLLDLARKELEIELAKELFGD